MHYDPKIASMGVEPSINLWLANIIQQFTLKRSDIGFPVSSLGYEIEVRDCVYIIFQSEFFSMHGIHSGDREEQLEHWMTDILSTN